MNRGPAPAPGQAAGQRPPQRGQGVTNVSDHGAVPSDAVRKGRTILFAAIAMSLALGLLRLAGPVFMVLVYDRVLPARSEETLVALFLMLLGVVAVAGIVDYARRRIMARFGAQFQERIEVEIFRRTPREDFLLRGSSKPSSGLDEVDSLRSFFHSGAMLGAMDFLWMPLYVAFVFVISPALGWVLLGGMVVLLVVILARMWSAAAREREAKAAGQTISELKHILISSRDLLRGQEMTVPFKTRWLAARRHSRDQAITLHDFIGWFDAVARQIKQLVHYGILAVGAWLAIQGSMTIGGIVACVFIANRCIQTSEGFFSDLPALRQAMTDWKALQAILSARRPAEEDPYAEAAQPDRARLSLLNLTVKAPHDATPILRGMTMNIAPGQVVEITGPPGSGKTVMAETILGIWKRSGGAVLYNGTNVARMTEGESARIFGHVPELPAFLPLSIEENICRMEADPDRARIAEVCAAVGLHDRILALPEGYQTRLDRSAMGFSRSERQRLALARAIYHMPEVLILDVADEDLAALLCGPLAGRMKAKKAQGMIVLLFSRQPLGLPYTTGSVRIEDGRLRSAKLRPALKPVENAKAGKGTPLLRGGEQ